MKLTLITTGGTIDGADADTGTLADSSDAARWLQSQPDIAVSHIPLLNKDSRLLTDDDRRTIVTAVTAAASERVLITHGTFTICQTGRAIMSATAQRSATAAVVLVGSWAPFGDTNSDAPLQMTFALQQLRNNVKGVFVAMDGRLWNPAVTEKIEIRPGVYRLLVRQE